jgi:hexosaminidase
MSRSSPPLSPAQALAFLWPRPRKSRAPEGSWSCPPTVVVAASPGVDDFTAERAALLLESRGVRVRSRRGNQGAVRLRLVAAMDAMELGWEFGGDEGYRLSIQVDGIEVSARHRRGLLHGLSTLQGWLALHGLQVPCLEVEDAPDFPHRGVLLDISRDKVPTMETLRALVDRLADWKINQLQLYMEHTFAYHGHEKVWRGASPWTADEIRRLDGYCAERGIELVPNQNSFGHLHHWLRHEPYRWLAECPEGVKHPFGDAVEPFSLCPLDPGSLDLLEDLYDQLLPCFQSRMANVGLDETFDLGQGRSAAACAERGRHRVYLEFLMEVYGLLSERGKRMQFWGDIVLEEPQLIGELPRDLIALEWGYEADHPFAEHGRLFAESGLEYYVCPGTSSWISLTGRVDNALGNLAAAARAGQAQGASGMLICDWGDYGHLQPLPVSYPGLLAGAGFAWNVSTAAEPTALPLAELLTHHAVDDPVLGQALVELGKVYQLAGRTPKNGSALFHLLLFAGEPMGTAEGERFHGVTVATLETALEHLRQATAPLRGSERLEARELCWAADLLAFACHLGQARLGHDPVAPLADLPAAIRAALRQELEPLRRQHRHLWLARNRPGGLENSAHRLNRIAEGLQ